MKKIILSTLLVFLTGFAFSQDCSNNLMQNSGFELGPAAWDPDPHDLIGISTTNYHSGARAGYLEAKGEFRSQAATGCTPGHEYKLTFWADYADATYGKITLTFYGAGYQNLLSQEKVYLSGTGWREYTITATAPAGTEEIEVGFYKNTVPGRFYIDDVCLVDMTDGSGAIAQAPHINGHFSSANDVMLPADVQCIESSGSFVVDAEPWYSVSRGRIKVQEWARFGGPGYPETHVIPGPYPPEFNSSVTINIKEIIVCDGYGTRATTGGPQSGERVKIQFYKDGQLQAETPSTPDLTDNCEMAQWIGSLGIVDLPNGTDEIRIYNYGNSMQVPGICMVYVPLSGSCPEYIPDGNATEPLTASQVTMQVDPNGGDNQGIVNSITVVGEPNPFTYLYTPDGVSYSINNSNTNLKVIDKNMEVGYWGQAGFTMALINANVDRDLDHYAQWDENVTNGDYVNFTYSVPIKSAKNRYVVVTERLGNNPYKINALDENGNVIGDSKYALPGNYIGSGFNTTRYKQEVKYIVYPLTAFVSKGTEIYGIRLTQTTGNGDGGDGKIFILADPFTLGSPPTVAGEITVKHAGCLSGGTISFATNGTIGETIESSINGATGPFTSATSYSNLTPGDYTLHLRYAAYPNCFSEYSFTILEPDCPDSDGDGIIDINDLDDDNDGIRDVDENTCGENLVANSSFEADNFLNGSVGTVWTGYGSYFGVHYTASSVSNNDQVTGWSYTTNCDGWSDAGDKGMAKAADGHQYMDILGKDDGKPANARSNVLSQTITTQPGKTYLFSFYWGEDMGHAFDTTPGETNITASVIDATNNSIIAIKNLREQATGRVDGIIGPKHWNFYYTIFVATSNATKIAFTAVPSGHALGNGAALDMVSVREVCDTDNDGIPNHLDLDSDNDGCPDAKEGNNHLDATHDASGTDLSDGNGKVVTHNLPEPVGTGNNLGIPTVAGSGQGVGYSQNKGLNYCLDSDGDGYPDLDDLDDDNDGILDCEEKGLSSDLSKTFVVNTDATFIDGNNEIQLTPEGNNKKGQAWSLGRADFTSSFGLRMQAYLGTRDNNGADGIAIVFHNDPAGTAAHGEDGRGIGARGIQNGIVLELDTYDNSNDTYADPIQEDVSQDHGHIWKSVDQSSLSTTTPLPNLEDGNWHDVVITWNVNTRTLSYTVDGTLAGSYLNANIIDDIFGGEANPYFGYTSSTGGAKNLQKVKFNNVCDDLPLILDTDGDGIPNHLDLDSDNDGCSDAKEGAKHLNPTHDASGTDLTDGNGNVVTHNLPEPVGTGNNLGVPTVAGSGQGIGGSQIKALIKISGQLKVNSPCEGKAVVFKFIPEIEGVGWRYKLQKKEGENWVDKKEGDITENKELAVTLTEAAGIDDSGTYRIKVTNVNNSCLELYKEAVLKVHSIPTFTLEGDNAQCSKDSSEIKVTITSGADIYDIYLYLNGEVVDKELNKKVTDADREHVFVVFTSGKYSVKVFNKSAYDFNSCASGCAD